MRGIVSDSGAVCLLWLSCRALLLTLLITTTVASTSAQILPWPLPEVKDGAVEKGPGETDEPSRPRRRPGRGSTSVEPSQKAEDQKNADEEAAEEPEDRWFAVVGGMIHTVSDGVIETGTILCKNGRIHEIGIDLPLPSECETLTVEGHHVYPGLIAVDSSGIVSSPKSINPYAFNLLLALAGGVTTARTGSNIVKLAYGTLDEIDLGTTSFVNLRYSTRNPASRRELREALERIREFKRELARHEEEKKQDPKLEDLDRKWIRGLYSTAEKLIDRKAVGWIRLSEAHEIRDVCALAERFDFALVIQGAEEGWIVAPEIARSGAQLVLTPRARRDRNDLRVAPNGGSIENASILHSHGVTFTIFPVGSLFAAGGGISLSGLAGRDLLNLPLEAAFAVRGGMPEKAAVRAITLDAARLLGVDHRVGSIEVGKDADFVITDGDLLHYLTLPQWTVVGGRVVYDQDAAGILDHIRPAGDPEPQAPPESWPRKLGDPF